MEISRDLRPYLIQQRQISPRERDDLAGIGAPRPLAFELGALSQELSRRPIEARPEKAALDREDEVAEEFDALVPGDMFLRPATGRAVPREKSPDCAAPLAREDVESPGWRVADHQFRRKRIFCELVRRSREQGGKYRQKVAERFANLEMSLSGDLNRARWEPRLGELLKYRNGLLMTQAYHGRRRREHLV